MNTIDEKTFKQGVDEFIGCAPEGGWSDYWAMQQDWEFYKDSLCRDGVITQKQADSWSNPCTPDTFDRWQRRNGLVSRGYESKKSEASYDYQDPRGGTAASLFSLHMKELLGSWIKAGNRSKYKVYVTEDRSAGSPVWTVHIDVNGEPVASVSFSDGNYTYTRFDNNKTTTGKVADFNKRGRVIYPMATEILNMVGKILGEGDSNESKKNEDTYDRPVTLYATTRYDDAEEVQKFLDSISGGEVKVSTERNGDTLSVSIEGADEDIDAFLAVYKDNYDTLEKDCDADVNGWTDPVDLKYYTAQGRKELTGESHKKSEGLSKQQILVRANKNPKLDDLLSDMGSAWVKVLPTDAHSVTKRSTGERLYSNKFSNADMQTTVEIAWTDDGVVEWARNTYAYEEPMLESRKKSMGRDQFIKDVLELADAEKQEYYRDELVSFARGCYDHGETSVDKVLSDYFADTYEAKKSEGIGDRIKMGIDYNMFMRMCGSAAYLDDNEDYWDALWEYYSEMGEIEDACEFFDNLFQYTAWCDADKVYDEYLDDKFKDESKSKEECIQAAIDDGDLDAYKHDSGNYLVIS